MSVSELQCHHIISTCHVCVQSVSESHPCQPHPHPTTQPKEPNTSHFSDTRRPSTRPDIVSGYMSQCSGHTVHPCSDHTAVHRWDPTDRQHSLAPESFSSDGQVHQSKLFHIHDQLIPNLEVYFCPQFTRDAQAYT